MLDKTVLKTKSKDCVLEIFGLGYVGFPLAITLSWIYDLTSKGVEKTKP